MPEGGSGGTVSIDDILKTHVLSFDLEARRSIIITGSALTEEMKKLADFYHISLFSGKNLDIAARNLCTSYSET